MNSDIADGTEAGAWDHTTCMGVGGVRRASGASSTRIPLRITPGADDEFEIFADFYDT